MKTYSVLIRGESSFLMHAFGVEAQAASGKATRTVKVQEETPREAAEKVAYRAPDNSLYFPAAAIMGMLRNAGSYHKQKGSRKSVKYIIPAACRVMGDTITFIDPHDETPIKDYEVDSRPVVIPSTKGRIMRHRPRLDEWAARFNLVIHEDVLDPAFLHNLLVEGGQRIGIGDFRPEKGGGFGVFQVHGWEEFTGEEEKPAAKTKKATKKKTTKKTTSRKRAA
jgi:hypothetical protein